MNSVLPWADYKGIITSVIIESGAETIAVNAFAGCEKPENVVLPEGLQSIGSGAFQRCAKLESIEIPKSVSSGCTILKTSKYIVTTVPMPITMQLKI